MLCYHHLRLEAIKDCPNFWVPGWLDHLHHELRTTNDDDDDDDLAPTRIWMFLTLLLKAARGNLYFRANLRALKGFAHLATSGNPEHSICAAEKCKSTVATFIIIRQARTRSRCLCHGTLKAPSRPTCVIADRDRIKIA